MSGLKKTALASLAILVIGVGGAPTVLSADPAAKPIVRFSKKTSPLAANPIPCTCRFQGEDYMFGETVCIRGRQASCDRVLNNTSWRFSEKPCMFLSNLDPAMPRG